MNGRSRLDKYRYLREDVNQQTASFKALNEMKSSFTEDTLNMPTTTLKEAEDRLNDTSYFDAILKEHEEFLKSMDEQIAQMRSYYRVDLESESETESLSFDIQPEVQPSVEESETVPQQQETQETEMVQSEPVEPETVLPVEEEQQESFVEEKQEETAGKLVKPVDSIVIVNKDTKFGVKSVQPSEQEDVFETVDQQQASEDEILQPVEEQSSVEDETREEQQSLVEEETLQAEEEQSADQQVSTPVVDLPVIEQQPEDLDAIFMVPNIEDDIQPINFYEDKPAFDLPEVEAFTQEETPQPDIFTLPEKEKALDAEEQKSLEELLDQYTVEEPIKSDTYYIDQGTSPSDEDEIDDTYDLFASESIENTDNDAFDYIDRIIEGVKEQSAEKGYHVDIEDQQDLFEMTAEKKSADDYDFTADDSNDYDDDDVSAEDIANVVKSFDFSDEPNFGDEPEPQPVKQPITIEETPVQYRYYDDSENVRQLTKRIEEEKLKREEILEQTKQLKLQVSEYENELNDVNNEMNKTNKLLNLLLTFLILALFIILLVIGYWFAQERGLL